jgi:hypothetical protein
LVIKARLYNDARSEKHHIARPVYHSPGFPRSPLLPHIHNVVKHHARHKHTKQSMQVNERVQRASGRECGRSEMRICCWRRRQPAVLLSLSPAAVGLYSAVSRIRKECPWQEFLRQTLTVAQLETVRRLQRNPNVHYRVHKKNRH